jgi:serine/threonine protein kinase
MKGSNNEGNTGNTIGTRIKLLEPLGKGGYGSVYKCTDEFGAQLAIKCIDTDTSGIPCLMETSIMSTIIHPNLHRAIHVHILPRKLYLISEMAVSDLSKWTRKDRKNHCPTFEEIRLWSYSLIQAVACLHRQSIMHCDIKSSNVLIFADGTIKLTDYTLSIKKWNDPTASRRHTICTCTHRPLEVWLNRDWDFSVDIWSLGCTLVELLIGELLFPYQGPEKDEILREKTINCLLDWGERGPEGPQRTPINKYKQDFIPFRECFPIKLPDGSGILEDLILPMLRIDPLSRPSVFELIKSPLFDEQHLLSENNGTGAEMEPDRIEKILPQLQPSSYSITSTPMTELNEKEITRLKKQISRFTSSNAVISLAIELHGRCTGIRYINDYLKLATCLWIAGKLILRTPITTDVPLHQVLSTERTICTFLSFRLHVASNPRLIIDD